VAYFLAAPSAGIEMAIKMAIIATTTSNSINVNAFGAFMMSLVFSCINQRYPLARLRSTAVFFNAV
jgi:hypothetical protein